MTEPVALSGPQRIIRRVVAERRAGTPDEMIAKYAITEALHLLTRHDGPAADCTRCHDTTARAVNDVRDPGDMTGASIVAPDPLKLPAYAWGESVTWNRGRILVPLNRDGETVADLVLDEDAAGTLAAMLDDAAGHKPPDCPRCFDRGYVPDWSRGLSAEHGEPGKKPCPDCQGDAVARETAERTPPGEAET